MEIKWRVKRADEVYWQRLLIVTATVFLTIILFILEYYPITRNLLQLWTLLSKDLILGQRRRHRQI